MSGTTPFFSVIVSTYNRAALLQRALDSLLTQTERDWEAVVVDDGSTDDTFSRIAARVEAGEPIRYLRLEHRGEALSKNAGILAANGTFITFLDSDDEYDETHLASRKAILTDNASVQFLHGGVRIIGNPYVPDRFDPSRRIQLEDCAIGGTFVIRREVLLTLGGFHNILLGPDADLFERAQKAGIRMLEVTDPTYIYHHDTKDSVTNTFRTGS